MRLRRLIAAAFAVLLIMMIVPAQAAQSDNLLRNPGFEEIDGYDLPVGWRYSAWHTEEGYTNFTVSTEACSGEHSIQVENLGENDARFEQTVRVEPNSTYCFSGYIRAAGIPESGWGANLSVAEVYITPVSVYATNGEWVYTEIYGETGPDQRELTVYARVGGFSGLSEGKAQFDDLCLRKVSSVPMTSVAEKWYREKLPVIASVDDTDDDETASSPFWPYLLVLSAVYAVVALCMVPALKKSSRELQKKYGVPGTLALGLFAAFVVRFVISVLVDGYQVDVGCFLSWGSTMASKGPGRFYASAGYCDYPPAYMYVLGCNHALQEAVRGMFGGLLPGWLRPTFFVKLLPMLCDIGIAAMVYMMAHAGRMDRRQSTVLSLLVAFNPVMIINSAAWCQVDSVLALLLLAVCWLAIQRKWTLLMPVYVLAILVKPQALMVGPLGLAVLVMTLVDDPKQWKPMLLGVGAALVLAIVVVLPFMLGENGLYIYNQDGDFWLTALYAKTLESYPHATVNTANLYYLFNANWAKLEYPAYMGTELMLAVISILWGLWEFWLLYRKQKRLFWLEPAMALCFAIAFVVMAFTGVTWATVGYAAMALCFAVVLPPTIRSRKIELLPLMGGVLFLLLYVLGTKMHERYLFPAIAMLAVAYVYRRDKRILWLLVLTSCTMFINEGIVLDNSIRLGSTLGHLNNDTKGLAMVLSVLNLGAVLLSMAIISLAGAGEEVTEQESRLRPLMDKALPKHEKRPAGVLNFTPDSKLHWKKLDTILVLSVTAVYAVLAFCNLGSVDAPQTMWTPIYPEDYVVIDLGEHRDNMTMLYYCAVSKNPFTVEMSDDGENWSGPYWADMKEGMCYQWRYLMPCTVTEDDVKAFSYSSRISGVQRLSGRYARITAQQVGLRLGEVVFRNESGENIVSTLLYAGSDTAAVNAAALVDEPHSIAGDPSWYTGTYFDEIYHARTAKELKDRTTIYETTHPPLGKVMMSWCVSIFGMTPFGWRFAGTLMGVLMLPGMYLLAKQLTKRTDMAFAAMSMMALDAMHFTQTRIATIDSFPVLFIIFSYFFMVRFMQHDITLEPVKKLLPELALSGFFMGCGMASKWIGIYAGAGLAVLFFWTCARHVRLSVEAIRVLSSGVKLSKDEKAKLRQRADHTLSRLLILCLWCLLFFVAVPLVIYLLSYIPHLAHKRPQGLMEYIRMVIAEQEYMLWYHSQPGLGMDHAYYSPWYEWLVIGKPMYYYSAQYMPEGYSQSIYCLGNPAIWLPGLAALAITCFKWAKRHVYMLEGADERVHLLSDSWKIAPAFVLIGYLTQLLPWVLVPRGTYIYHYFASIPFLILSVMLVLYWISRRWPRAGRLVLILYLVVCLVFFVIFYPYVSGIPAPKWWLEIGKRVLGMGRLYYSP